MHANEVLRRLAALGDPRTASVLRGFFKTGPGEYGAGDVFLGIHVPVLRKLAREYRTLSLAQTLRLLRAPVHEARALALFLLVQAYARGTPAQQVRIYRAYLGHTRFINNWDLVDTSAEHIVGRHLGPRARGPVLRRLAASPRLWERRIAMLATLHYIRRGDFTETLRLARRLLGDGEDLMHKAVGWMLREIGKRDRAAEETFLRAHYRHMPRTMLRYAIERFPEDLRQWYLQGRVAQRHADHRTFRQPGRV